MIVFPVEKYETCSSIQKAGIWEWLLACCSFQPDESEYIKFPQLRLEEANNLNDPNG